MVIGEPTIVLFNKNIQKFLSGISNVPNNFLFSKNKFVVHISLKFWKNYKFEKHQSDIWDIIADKLLFSFKFDLTSVYLLPFDSIYKFSKFNLIWRI